MLVPSPCFTPSLTAEQPEHLTDRQLLASMMRTEKETRRTIALSYEMIADTLKQIAEMDTMRFAIAIPPANPAS